MSEPECESALEIDNPVMRLSSRCSPVGLMLGMTLLSGCGSSGRAPVSIDAVALQIDPAHTGAVRFSSVTFPSAARWSVDVGGEASYALIAQGKVFITTTSADSRTTHLIALEQASGDVAWGPIALAGVGNAAYDSGQIFVAHGFFDSPVVVESFDAESGQPRWSATLDGQYPAFPSAPVAANSVVYEDGNANDGTLYALDEATGAILWTLPGKGGAYLAPAATDSGVYLAGQCSTDDFDPGTGGLVWSYFAGCAGGTGGTPAIANDLVYVPNGPNVAGVSGPVLDAATGKVSGTYSADGPGAFAGQTGYFVYQSVLRGIDLSTGSVLWSFAGQGELVASPVAVNQYVFVGSVLGDLYALDGATGKQVWHVKLASSLPVIGWSGGAPLSGLTAGDGILVVPVGNTVTAYTLSENP
jgi:outer membrane protein assembly factor BamB